MSRRRLVLCLIGVLALAASAAGCAEAAGAPGASAADGVRVVASTDVYGDIARRIAGDRPVAEGRVSITSIIDNPGTDPHSYEADIRDQLAISKAEIVIENGGGYDDFVDTMLRAVKHARPTVLNAVRISGRSAPAGGEVNEHVWYDFPAMARLADQLVDALSAADPVDAPTFAAGGASFQRELRRLEATEASIKAAHAGTGAAVTEPVPLYLLAACGLINKTPVPFSAAIEEGTAVPVAVLRQTLDLFHDKQVRLLAYNEGTAGPQTQRVVAAARAENVPVVAVTETLPDGKDYLAWMSGNLSAIQAALG